MFFASRSQLAAITAAAAVLLGVGVPQAAAASPMDLPPLFMQVVAHEDDDLFFMNPDIDHSIAAGLPTVTVYVTAGQLTGDGASPEEKARNRQRGVQNAYATMAGLTDGDDTTQAEWDGQVWPVAGKLLERYTLRDRPNVALVFMNLHDGNLSSVDTAGGSDDTVIPAGGLVTSSSHYTRGDVVAVLRALLTAYRPTVLRAQDTEPDRRAGYSSDHADHVAAARFAQDAAAGYIDPLYQVNYRGYNIRDVSPNLGPADTTRKTAIAEQYYRYDHGFKDSQFCDRCLSRMYYRWSHGTAWAAKNQDGRAQVFVVRNGAVHTYAQTSTGGWTSPLRLADAGGAVAPGLAVGRNQDGTLEVFALRLRDHHLLSLPQNVANGAFRSWWFDLGNPNEGLFNQDQVSAPAVASNGDGRLEIFVKNGGGGVSTRYQTTPNGGWNPGWVDLFGTDVQDGLAAITNPHGRIELFASTRAKILHWFQLVPNQGFTRSENFPSGPPASPPQASLSQGGGIEIAWRQPGTGHLMLTYQFEAGCCWQTTPVDIGGDGSGQPAMVTAPPGADARIMIFERNRLGGLSTTRQAGPNIGYRPWENLAGYLIDHPAATTDTTSRAVVFAIGANGLYVRRQTTTGGGTSFGTWETLGM